MTDWILFIFLQGAFGVGEVQVHKDLTHPKCIAFLEALPEDFAGIEAFCIGFGGETVTLDDVRGKP